MTKSQGSPDFVSWRQTWWLRLPGGLMGRILTCIFLLFTILTGICSARTGPQAGNVPGIGGAAASVDRRAKRPGESWTELNAVKSGLDPSRIASAVLGRSDLPGYSNELVRLEWRQDDPIDVYVVRPHGVTRPPVILYLYSYPADTDRFQNKAWCEQVTKNGFAAVGLVSALTGERYHSRPMREWFVSELQEALGTTTHDVQMVLSYLATRGDLDAEKVGMLGEGSGGAIAILAGATDPRIEFVDVINPWGDWPDWLKESPVIPEKERAAYLKPEFLSGVAPLDPMRYLPQFAPVRLRVEQVAGDLVTPRAAQTKLRTSAPGSSVVEYKDRNAQIDAWMKQNWWLKEQLGRTAHPAVAAGKAP
jgi:hypothetical protein